TKTDAKNYDKIFTGDLGYIGTRLLYELLYEEGYDIREKHSDCGMMIYDMDDGDVNAGGSGCGCGASVLCGYILKEVENGHFENVLFVATGALMSTTSIQQGESIPAVAHLAHISSKKQDNK
ncbi:MAG: stage V sporulation protein AD, partial [Oscillospiraceae bacterium]